MIDEMCEMTLAVGGIDVGCELDAGHEGQHQGGYAVANDEGREYDVGVTWDSGPS